MCERDTVENFFQTGTRERPLHKQDCRRKCGIEGAVFYNHHELNRQNRGGFGCCLQQQNMSPLAAAANFLAPLCDVVAARRRCTRCQETSATSSREHWGVAVSRDHREGNGFFSRTPTSSGVSTDHPAVRFGYPVTSHFLVRDAFVLQYDPRTRNPMYVLEFLSPDSLEVNVVRRSDWSAAAGAAPVNDGAAKKVLSCGDARDESITPELLGRSGTTQGRGFFSALTSRFFGASGAGDHTASSSPDTDSTTYPTSPSPSTTSPPAPNGRPAPNGNNGNASVSGTFQEETSVSPAFRATNRDFARSGLDRGHMAAAGNHRKTVDEFQSTFTLANISPQVGWGLNRTYWMRLESWCRGMARRHEWAIVATGPVWAVGEYERWAVESRNVLKGGEQEPSASSTSDPECLSDGASVGTARAEVPWWRKDKLHVKHEALGAPNRAVAIPTHFFKLVLIPFSAASAGAATVRAGEGSSEGSSCYLLACFLLPNKEIPESDPLEKYVVPLEEVEGLTGIEFFPELLDTPEKRKLLKKAEKVEVADRKKLKRLKDHAGAVAGGPSGRVGGGVLPLCLFERCQLKTVKWDRKRGVVRGGAGGGSESESSGSEDQ